MARYLLTFLFLLCLAPLARAEPVVILPSGITHTVPYFAATTTTRVCFYQVESDAPDAQIVDRDGADGITQADAIACEAPERTCNIDACSREADANSIEITSNQLFDFYLIAIGYRELDLATLESPRSNLGQAVTAPGAPIILGGAWYTDDPGGGNEA